MPKSRPLYRPKFHERLVKLVAITPVLLIAVGALLSKPVIAQVASTTVFVNVNVIPVDTERVLEDQTVIVEGDRITTVGSTDEVAVPDEAEIIEGNGAYLMPGLADMHTHLSFDADPKFMRLYLAQGVTTVRNLGATPEHLGWREQVASGKLLGPTIYTSGNIITGLPAEFRSMPYTFRAILILSPIVIGIFIWLLSKYTGLIADFGRIRRFILPSLAGLLLVGGVLVWSIPLTSYVHLSFPFASVPETEAEVRRFVREQHAAGVDFIKPYDFLTRKQYFAVMDEAEKLGMYTAGHIPDQPEVVSVREMIDAGQDEVAHVDEFTHEFWVDYDPIVSEEAWIEFHIDMSLIDEVAAMTAENDVAVTLTLITNETILLGLEDMTGLLQQPEYQVVRPSTMKEWRTGGRLVNWAGQEKYRREQWRPLLMQLTKALHDHGTLLTLGADVSVEGVVPGISVHQELALLVEAGLTPFEALAAGTRNAGLIVNRMGHDDSFGTVASGQRADLVLLRRNPLEDITHAQDRLGVMVRGNWYTQEELDKLAEEFLTTY